MAQAPQRLEAFPSPMGLLALLRSPLPVPAHVTSAPGNSTTSIVDNKIQTKNSRDGGLRPDIRVVRMPSGEGCPYFLLSESMSKKTQPISYRYYRFGSLLLAPGDLFRLRT